jgi:hypothetical protein
MNKQAGADIDYIKNVIYEYNDMNYQNMAALILDYPPALFFPHLFEYMTGIHYAVEMNKHLLFVGITTEYIKVIESIEYKTRTGFFEDKATNEPYQFNDFFR